MGRGCRGCGRSAQALAASLLLAACGDGPGSGTGADTGGSGSQGPAQVEPQGSPPARTLQQIKASGTLRVLTRNAPTTWYIDRDGQPSGPEHDLVEAFAADLGVDAEYVMAPTVDEILRRLAAGEADLAA